MRKRSYSEVFQKKTSFFRCAFILGLLFVLQHSSAAINESARLTIVARNELFRNVLKQIEQEAQVHFMYEESIIPKGKRISINATNLPLSSVLNDLCVQTNLSYEVKKEYILLTQRSAKAEIRQDNKAQFTITGIVSDEQGLSLPGATVRINGQDKGTITDVDGKYSIKVSEGDILIYSYVGMKLFRSVVKNNKPINVTLYQNTEDLGEVVVTGYQTISKERATGSYNILKKEQLEKPTTNIASRLIGTTTGVQATIDANGDPKFEIRGLSSLGSNASPLVVVDGFAIQGDFNSLNPNDVESVTILKDAAAASIWGARSANGVIVVTTKSGKNADKGKVNVTYSNFFKFAPKMDLDYKFPNASNDEIIDYEIMLLNKSWGFMPITNSPNFLISNFSPIKIALSEHSNGLITDEELNGIISSYRGIDNKSQLKKHILQNPFTQQHDLSFSSSSEKMSHYASVMFQQREKELKGNEDMKFMVNFRSEFKIRKWLDFSLGGTYLYQKDKNNSTGIPAIMPYQLLADSQGNRLDVGSSFYWPNMNRYVPMEKFPYSDWTYNPITERENQNITREGMNARIQGILTFKIIEGLSLTGKIQYELNHNYSREYYNDKTYKVRSEINTKSNWDRKTNVVMPNISKGGILDQRRDKFDGVTWQGLLNFNREFGNDHAIAFLIGSEANSRVSQYTTSPRVYGYSDDRLTVGSFPNGLGSNTNPNLYLYGWNGYKFSIPQSYSFSHQTERFFSAYANANYTYKERYSLSGSVRTDASNMITDDPKYRYAPFWSVGASWQVSNEDFMEKYNFIDLLTIRGTFGYNGNVDRSTSFKPLINIGDKPNINTDEMSASISSFGNPSLRWERTASLNFGVDYSLWNNKLYGSIEYYSKRGKDLIAAISIPAVNGTTSQKLNTASLLNRGIEVEIGTRQTIIPKQLHWRGAVNFSYNDNKVTKLFRSSFTHSDLIPWNGGKATFVEGKNANTLWGMEYAGIFNDGTDQSPNWQPKIIGNDGVMYGLGMWPTGDPLSYCFDQGTSIAPWLLGFNSGFTYKGIDLSFILTGKFGHKFRRTFYNYNGGVPNKYYSEVVNADPMKVMPLPQSDTESRYYFWNRFWPYYTYLTESANHIRMQEIAISYEIPSAITRKLGLSQLRVYTQVNNVFSIYANKYKEDPEFQLGSYKLQPNYTIGVKISL